MARLAFPPRIKHTRHTTSLRTCPAHRAWVRGHRCSVPGCHNLPVECAHVREGADGGTGLKPSDRWVISLCSRHHREQHHIGESAFARKHRIDLQELAQEFARRSPHRRKLLPIDVEASTRP
jgi:hypothetical protein